MAPPGVPRQNRGAGRGVPATNSAGAPLCEKRRNCTTEAAKGSVGGAEARYVKGEAALRSPASKSRGRLQSRHPLRVGGAGPDHAQPPRRVGNDRSRARTPREVQ